MDNSQRTPRSVGTTCRRRPRPRRAPTPRATGRRVGAGITAVLLVVLAGCSGSGGRQVRSDAALQPAELGSVPATSDALWAFTADLHRALARGAPDENSVVAPVPVALGLAQAAAGANGATLDQLLAALHGDADVLGPGLDAVTRDLAAHSGPHEDRLTGREGSTSVELASTLWAQRGTSFDAAWLDRLARTWGAGVRVTEFRSDPEEARTHVNEWVSDQTNDHITQLLPRGSLDQMTRFLATSATYLKAPWRTPFPAGSNRLAPFSALDGASETAVFLRLDATADAGLRSGRGDGWQAVEMPYLGDGLAFTVVLPDAGRFRSVEADLDGPRLQALRRSLRSQAVDLSIPRFAFTSDLRLDDALGDLGVTEAFDPSTANFSGITGDEPLWLWGVAHQSYLAVDEEGTEATASAPRPSSTVSSTTSLPATTAAPPGTGTMVPAPAAPVSTVEPDGAPSTTRVATATVTVDRPFLVLVTDRVTGAPLFYGRVLSPTA